MPVLLIAKYVGPLERIKDGPSDRTFERGKAVEVTMDEYDYFKGKSSFKVVSREVDSSTYEKLQRRETSS